MRVLQQELRWAQLERNSFVLQEPELSQKQGLVLFPFRSRQTWWPAAVPAAAAGAVRAVVQCSCLQRAPQTFGADPDAPG